MNQEKKILSAIKAAIHSVDANAEVILFGSRARGDAHEESDWDVLILVDEQNIDLSYKWQFQKPMLHVELQFGIAVSKLILNRQKWNRDYLNYPLHIEIQKDGQLL